MAMVECVCVSECECVNAFVGAPCLLSPRFACCPASLWLRQPLCLIVRSLLLLFAASHSLASTSADSRP